MSALDQNATLRQRLGFLFRDAAFYSVIGTLSRLTQLFVFPIIARLLTESEYGLTDVVWVFVGVFAPLVVMGQSTTIGRYYYDVESKQDKKRIIFNGLSIQLVPIIIVTATLVIANDAISVILLGDVSYSSVIRLAFLSLPFLAIQDNVLNILKYTFRRARFAITAILPTILVPALTVALVGGWDAGVEGVFIAWLIAYGTSSLLGLLFCVDLLHYEIDFGLIKRLLTYGLPVIIVSMLPTILPAFDRYLVTSLLGLASAGIYGVAHKVAKIPHFLVASFHIAYGPFALATYKHENASMTFIKVLNYVSYGLSAIALGLVVFGEPFIVILASERYLVSYQALWPLVFAVVFRGASSIVWLGVAVSKRTIFLMLGALAQLAVVVGLDYLLIPQIGILGGALGILAGEIVYFIVIAVSANYLYPIKYQYGLCLILACISLALAVLVTGLTFTGWVRVAIGVVTLLSFMTIGVFLVSTRSERVALVRWIGVTLQRKKLRHFGHLG